MTLPQNSKRRRLLIGLVLVVVVAGIVAVDWAAGRRQAEPPRSDAQVNHTVREPAASPPQDPSPGSREPAAADVAAPDTAAFTSGLNSADTPDSDPVRDGLTILVREEGGAPCAAMTMTVFWRKGFGLYGKDRGATDAMGRFATTVQRADQFEHIELTHPELGELSPPDDLLPMAGDPRTILLVVPQRAPLQVRAVDLDGQAVPGVVVDGWSTAMDLPPREYRLYLQDSPAETNERGHAELSIPAGMADVHAKKPGFTHLTASPFPLAAGGGALKVVMVDHGKRREVQVFATLPPEFTEPPTVSAFSRDLPAALAKQLGVNVKQSQRKFESRTAGDHFVVPVDPLPWRLVVGIKGCTPTIVDLPDHLPSIHVTLERLPPEAPTARIVVEVTDPDGAPVPGADVRLHKTPDLVYGSKLQADETGQYVFEVEPGQRVCVSAWQGSSTPKYSRTIAGPFVGKLGEQRVALQLRTAQQLTGRVVDGLGNAVDAVVELRRPAEVLRALRDDVPEVLGSAPSEDRTGTGAGGRFKFQDLYPGPHVVWAKPRDGGWPGAARTVPGEDVTVVLGQGLENYALVDVVVRDAKTGSPIRQCNVRGLGYTDDDGRVRRAVLPGELEFLIYAKERVATPWGPRTIGPGPLPIEIRIERSRPVFVRVLDASGRPIGDAEVRALGDDGEPLELVDAHGTWDGDYARTNAAGRTEMRGLPDGPLRLRVERDEANQEFTMPGTSGREAVFEVRWRD